MIDFDDRELKALEQDMKNFAADAIPYASRNTVNTLAFATRKRGQDNIRDKMVTRNRWTVGSVRVNTTKSLNMRQMAAVVGSTEDYMKDQEFGATKTKKGSEGVAIPTAYSAGQGEDARPRTRLPRKPNKMQNITLRNRKGKAKSRRQANLLAVQAAANSGNKYAFLDLGRRKGIFRVTGGKRNPRVKMVWDLTRQSVRINPTPWLGPAVQDASRLDGPRIMLQSLQFQAKRRRLFGYR